MPFSPQRGKSGGRLPLRPRPYDPEMGELARGVEGALLDTEARRLNDVPEFLGAGIYVLYYHGPHDLYQPIAGTTTPIYVGKAEQRGARKGRNDASAVGKELWGRLEEHRKSTAWATDLDPADFHVRYLVTEEMFISLAERLMIRSFSPVWNQVVDGFGNHDPGGGRYNQRVSPWDTLHPGRPWVSRLTKSCKYTREQILDMVHAHSAGLRVAAGVTLLPAAPRPLSLFDQDDDDMDEENED